MNHDLYDSAIVEELQAISLIIFGEPASKSNSRRVVRINNTSRLIKSKKALSYSDIFRNQCRRLTTLLTGDLMVTMHIHYASRRPDLDESLILDLMQGFIYENDRQVKERHTYWHLDKERPRAEIFVSKIEEIAPKKKPRQHRGKDGTAMPSRTPLRSEQPIERILQGKNGHHRLRATPDQN